MVRQASPLRGVLIAGVIVAGSVWAYKHFTAPGKLQPSRPVASQEARAYAGPVSEKGEPTIIEKVLSGGKSLVQATPFANKPMRREEPSLESINPDSSLKSQSTEDRVKSYYGDLGRQERTQR